MSGPLEDLRAQLAGIYRIDRELGGGGMSRVFLAEEIALGRRVVLKVLSPDLAHVLSAERFTTPDGRGYGYTWHRAMSDLYLVEGWV